jgi:magnesium-transporting ATPase (P-type)
VFDKTGTLTEDGLDIKFVLPIRIINQNYKFSKESNENEEIEIENKFLIEGMASCHSLTHINNELAGDPLDLKMFEFTKWTLNEPTGNENTLFDCLAPTIVFPKKKKSDNLSVSLIRV